MQGRAHVLPYISPFDCQTGKRAFLVTLTFKEALGNFVRVSIAFT